MMYPPVSYVLYGFYYSTTAGPGYFLIAKDGGTSAGGKTA